MKDILNISLVEAFKKYVARSDSDFVPEGNGKYLTLCHSHQDTKPSMRLYDKVDKGQGWDFHCFACGAHGNILNLLTDLGVAEDADDAVRIARRDFDLELPARVTLEYFCKLKGLNVEYCKNNGYREVEDGVRIDTLTRTHEVGYSKVRVKWEGNDKYYFIRGTEDSYVSPFGLHWLDGYDRSKPLYIVEGETDSTTLRQAGFQVLGYPSANAYDSVDNSFLSEFDEVIVPRDNDKAGLQFVNSIRKDKPKGLYVINFFGTIKDVNDFHVFVCNSSIGMFQQRFKTLKKYPVSHETLLDLIKDDTSILKDPNVLYNLGMFIENEIELDLMIEDISKASKISKKTLRSSIEKAFKDIKKSSADSVVSSDLTIRNNAYFKLKSQDGIPMEVPISNFIVRPTKVLDQDGDIIRVLTLINNKGKSAQNIVFSAEELTVPIKFSGKCMNSGDFLFKGGADDLQSIAELIFSKELSSVKSPSMVGRMEDGRWIFKNFGIDLDGSIIEVNEEGVIDFGNERYMPKSIYADDEGDTSTEIPDLFYSCDVPSGEFITSFLRKLKLSFGTEGVFTGLGWLVAGINSHRVFEKYKMFPYAMTIGKRNSGKSTYAGLVYEMCGFGQHKISSIESPTQVGMLRTLKYMSNLPVVYDDYRNTVKIKYKDNILLDIYNRHGGHKGTLQANVVRQEKIRGFVMLSGEDIPSNNALRTRCVEIHISANQGERSLENLHELQGMLPKMQRYVLQLIQNYQLDEHSDALMSLIADTSKILEDKVADQRYALNASIFAGAFLHAFGEYLSEGERDRFMEYVINAAVTDKKSTDEEHGEILFFKDICDMRSKRLIGNDIAHFDPADGELNFRIRPLHKEWTKYLKNTGTDSDVLGEFTLRKYFSKEEFFTDEQRLRTPYGNYRYARVNVAKLERQYPEIAEEILSVFSKSEEEDVDF